jgi:hypothetical protein
MHTPGIILEKISLNQNSRSTERYVKIITEINAHTTTRRIREIILDSFSNNSNRIKSKRIFA